MTEAVPWEQAWQQALYGPQGFYRRPEGPAGHFATSAQGIPHGSTVLARAVQALVRRHGLDTVVDLGAGRGELLADLAAQAPDLHLVGCDVVDRPTDLPQQVDWWRSPGGAALPDRLSALSGVLVLAHEWLDVVPCPVVVRDDTGVWRVLTVHPATGQERLGDPVGGAEVDWLQRWVPSEATGAEVGLPRERALADLASRVSSGLVVAVDYGHTREDRPTESTFVGYRHGRECVPLADGSCDLTAHVAVDALTDAVPGSTSTRQAALFDDLFGPATSPPLDLALSRPSAYLRALAEHSARRALTASGGLGDFWWVVVPCPATTTVVA